MHLCITTRSSAWLTPALIPGRCTKPLRGGIPPDNLPIGSSVNSDGRHELRPVGAAHRLAVVTSGHCPSALSESAGGPSCSRSRVRPAAVLCFGASPPLQPARLTELLRRRGGPSMLRSCLNPTAWPAPTPVSSGAEGYNFLSATAVPAWSRLRPSLASRSGPACVRGLRSTSGWPRSHRLARALRRWAEAPGEAWRSGRLSVNALGDESLRAPRCLCGGFAQLGSI